MNEVRDRLHGKEPNEVCFLGRDVMKSRLSCEGKKNGNNPKNRLRKAYFKMSS